MTVFINIEDEDKNIRDFNNKNENEKGNFNNKFRNKFVSVFISGYKL